MQTFRANRRHIKIQKTFVSGEPAPFKVRKEPLLFFLRFLDRCSCAHDYDNHLLILHVQSVSRGKERINETRFSNQPYKLPFWSCYIQISIKMNRILSSYRFQCSLEKSSLRRSDTYHFTPFHNTRLAVLLINLVACASLFIAKAAQT